MEYKTTFFIKALTRKGLMAIGSLSFLALQSCGDFVDIDPPNNQLTGTLVFQDAGTVDAALANVYAQLRENAFTTGSISGISYLMGHYADELELYSNTLPGVQSFSTGKVPSSDSSVELLWDESYELLYAVNDILEGVANSNGLSDSDVDRFRGEALFVRAFVHFHLMNLFGEVPYVRSTDYRVNSTIGRTNVKTLYMWMVEDLENSKKLLAPSLGDRDNFRPNYDVVTAFLARVHLYQGAWSDAVAEASDVLEGTDYQLNVDLIQVFTRESPETLWQLDPGISGNNTKEGMTFIFSSGPPPNSSLSETLVEGFETGDGRWASWVGSVMDGDQAWYFPNKYKLNGTTSVTEECSILLRLSELYLIVAEAHAQLGDNALALEHLNAIRERAGLAPLGGISGEALLDAIFQERRIELFSEQGHRFFDLKRSGRATSVLPLLKLDWGPSALRLPIPQAELLLNPNLEPQNEGY